MIARHNCELGARKFETKQPSHSPEEAEKHASAHLTRDLREAGITPHLLLDASGRPLTLEAPAVKSNFALRRAIDIFHDRTERREFYEVECPLSFEKCIFPVQLGDGHTYELEMALQLRPLPGSQFLESPFTRGPLPYPAAWTCNEQVLDLALYGHLAQYGDFAALPMLSADAAPYTLIGEPLARDLPTSNLARGAAMAITLASGLLVYYAAGKFMRKSPYDCDMSECFAAGADLRRRWLGFTGHDLSQAQTCTDISALERHVIERCQQSISACWEFSRSSAAITGGGRAFRTLGIGIGAFSIPMLWRHGYNIYASYQAYLVAFRATPPKPDVETMNLERRAAQVRAEQAYRADQVALRDLCGQATLRE